MASLGPRALRVHNRMRCGSLALVAALIAALSATVFATLALLFTMAPTHSVATVSGSPCEGAGDAGTVSPNPSGAGGLRISVDRDVVAIGTREHVSGTGWPAGQEVAITVEYDAGEALVDSSGLLATAEVVADGSFSSSLFRLPPSDCDLGSNRSLEGTVARVVARAGGAAKLSGTQPAVYVPLTIVAAPSVAVTPAPSRVIAGTRSLPVEGQGWGAGTQVSVGLGRAVDSSGVPPTGVALLPEAAAVMATADDGGAFTARVPIPPNLRWGTILEVVAAASTSAYGDVALVAPGFASPLLPPHPPQIVLALPGGAGGKIMVTGQHWWPGDALRLEACGYAPYSPANQGAVPLGSTVVRADGTLSKQLRLPPNVGTARRVAVLAFTDDYDPTTSPFFLQTAQFGAASAVPLALRIERPAWQFDLGALLGLILVVLVVVILAEPASRWWKARTSDR